jgi:1-deoxyxylulose-5-phosphate synthase
LGFQISPRLFGITFIIAGWRPTSRPRKMREMEYTTLGKTNLKVSRICMGCMSFGNESAWMLQGEQAKRVIQKALDAGINYFDTADVYSNGVSEEILGKALAGNDHLTIATKVGLQFGSPPDSGGLSADRIARQAQGSLDRLGRNRIDLYQIHRWDYGAPIEETLRALNALVKDGKVGHIGASAMYAWQFMQSLAVSERLGFESFASMQDRYNLVYREEEREMIPLCRQFGIAVVPYSPLARGFLSGKYHRGTEPDSVRYRTDSGFKGSYMFDNDFDVLERVKEVAREKGVKPPHVALAWLFSKPWITSVVLGATKAEQIDDAVEALSVRLSAGDISRLEENYLPHLLVGPVPPPSKS